MSPEGGSVIRLPAGFAARAGEVLAGREPVAPRDAATVMLLRPRPPAGAGADAGGRRTGGAASTRPAGMDVYMLRRAPSMAFAPGAVVFPGGSVDVRDAEAEVGWAGPDPAAWGKMIDAPGELARALICAAVRETFEEAGVLLAGPTPDTVVPSTLGDDWEADRQALLAREVSLADLLRRRRLVLRSDLLRPWSRWVTPLAESRRYDTRFFAAALPAGQRARDVSGEADQAAWVEPGEMLAASRRHEVFLLPPTAVSLDELRACGTVAAALAARRQIVPLMPEISLSGGAAWLIMPAGLEYPG